MNRNLANWKGIPWQTEQDINVIIPYKTRDYIAIAIGNQLVLKTSLAKPIPYDCPLIPFVVLTGYVFGLVDAS